MKTIGVFFGSRSPEHDISIITAHLIIAGLKKLGHSVVPVYIDKKGRWHINEKLNDLSYFTKNGADAIQDANFHRIDLDVEHSQGKLVLKHKGIMGQKFEIDLAFPAFHGAYGEDGTIQGLFEMFNVPYVGCGVAACAIAMDKVLTKRFYQAYRIPTPKFVSFSKEQWKYHHKAICEQVTGLTWPVFVKPSHLGSSIGIEKVKEEKELVRAIDVALHYDTHALVEESIENLKDITCCVIGNGKPRASLLQESIFASDLFNYEEKYLHEGGAQLGKATDSIVIPARLNAETTKAIQDLSLQMYTELGGSGIARIDFLYNTETDEYFANEINPFPGTLYHHLWKKSGLALGELLKNLIEYAFERQGSKSHITSTFESSVLKKAGSTKLQKGE